MNNLNRFVCHGEKSVYELRTIAQEPFSFISSGQDGTCKWYDIRQSTKCDKLFCQEHTLIKLSTGITAIAINPVVPYHLVCSGLDGILRFFDRRMLSVGLCDSDPSSSSCSISNQSTKGLFACFGLSSSIELGNSPRQSFFNSATASNKRITSVQYDNWGNEILVSYQSDNLYLLDWRVCFVFI